MQISGSNVRFSAFKLNFPKGKTQITKDNQSGKSVVFTDWELIRTIVPPYRASLKNDQGKQVAQYPVRQELKGDRITWVIDQLDPIGSQG